jgi:hypothetical protein
MSSFRRRLIFISAAEMDQLVGLSFSTLIRPWLMGMVAAANGTPNHRVKAIEASEVYKLLLRQTLFLGLSDGANTGRFRRQIRSCLTSRFGTRTRSRMIRR